MLKISKRVKQNKKEQDLIDLMRADLKKDQVVIDTFKKYKVPINKLDDVKVYFDDIDVSAKTINKVIILNRKLLDTDIKTIESYLVHELVHFNQQFTGKTQGHDSVSDYLDKPTEEKAFSAQIEFKVNHEGKEVAEDYVDELLEYHGLSKNKKKEKKKELMP